MDTNQQTENLQSDKLTALQAELQTLSITFDNLNQTDKFSKAWHDANSALYKKSVEIEAEKNNIRKQVKLAHDEEVRNAKKALITDYKDSIGTEGEQAAYDKLAEAILGAAKMPVKVAADGTAKPAGERGRIGNVIRELFIANRAAGMNDTENKKAIQAAGYSRGTTGAVVLAYQQEIGEKD